MFMATQASRNLLPSQPKPSTGVAQRSGAKSGAKRLISVPTTTPQHEINPLQMPSFLKALSFLTHPAIKFPEYPFNGVYEMRPTVTTDFQRRVCLDSNSKMN